LRKVTEADTRGASTARIGDEAFTDQASEVILGISGTSRCAVQGQDGIGFTGKDTVEVAEDFSEELCAIDTCCDSCVFLAAYLPAMQKLGT
jgi:hypothetical protein